ncbi:MAG: type I secretion system permease/ATPase, partial [Alphaproteobacteria bacterium]|nr:type I secretion system permease/ATPase [Alphaproteobacteria bacterium]
VLIFNPKLGRPEEILLSNFAQNCSGRVILVTTRAEQILARRQFDISWFIPAVAKYRKIFGEVLIASFGLQLFALVSPLLFQVITDKVLVHKALSSLNVIIIAMIVISLFELLLEYLRLYAFSHTTNRIDVELGSNLFQHLMTLPIAWHNSRRVGETIARVQEIEHIRSFLTGSALTLVIDTFFTVVFIIAMFLYSSVLAWIVIASLPFYAIISFVATPVLRQLSLEKFQRQAANQALLVETCNSIETCKSLAIEPQMQRHWEDQLAALVRVGFRLTHTNMVASQFVGTVQKLVTAITLWYGATLVMSNELTIGGLIAFNMMAGRVSTPILRLAQIWQDFQQIRISIDRLGDIFNTKSENSPQHNRLRLPTMEGQVDLKEVVFRYRADRAPVINGLNIAVSAGQVVGIVGSSGSGKSTLARLLQRLYVPESGRILLDGIDIANADSAWLRRQIGVVLQENWLFNRSIRENIAIQDRSMSFDRIIEAARIVGAHDFISQLPEGYDTILGERGASLSGGQRQRVAIARALVNNPKLLIFDEATSALDYESERAIQDNMRKICQGRTVFIIAHRLSTVRQADRILVIEAGNIIEDGSHTELLKSQGRYATLWNAQTGHDEEKQNETSAKTQAEKVVV